MQHPAAVFFFLFLQCMLQRKEKAGVLFSLHRKKKGALLKSRGKCLICRATPARTLAGSFSLRAKWAGPVLFSLGQLPWKQVLKIMHEDHYKYSFIFTVFFFFALLYYLLYLPPTFLNSIFYNFPMARRRKTARSPTFTESAMRRWAISPTEVAAT